MSSFLHKYVTLLFTISAACDYEPRSSQSAILSSKGTPPLNPLCTEARISVNTISIEEEEESDTTHQQSLPTPTSIQVQQRPLITPKFSPIRKQQHHMEWDTLLFDDDSETFSLARIIARDSWQKLRDYITANNSNEILNNSLTEMIQVMQPLRRQANLEQNVESSLATDILADYHPNEIGLMEIIINDMCLHLNYPEPFNQVSVKFLETLFENPGQLESHRNLLLMVSTIVTRPKIKERNLTKFIFEFLQPMFDEAAKVIKETRIRNNRYLVFALWILDEIIAIRHDDLEVFADNLWVAGNHINFYNEFLQRDVPLSTNQRDFILQMIINNAYKRGSQQYKYLSLILKYPQLNDKQMLIQAIANTNQSYYQMQNMKHLFRYFKIHHILNQQDLTAHRCQNPNFALSTADIRAIMEFQYDEEISAPEFLYNSVLSTQLSGSQNIKMNYSAEILKQGNFSKQGCCCTMM